MTAYLETGWHIARTEKVGLLRLRTQPGWVSLGKPYKSRTWCWAWRRSRIWSRRKEGLQLGEWQV